MATHSSILGWKIPWTEDPGGPQSMGLWRVRHNWETNTFTLHFYSWRIFKCTARGGGKVFFSFEAKKENHSSKPSRSDCEIFNPVQSPQSHFFFFFFFFFCSGARNQNLTEVTENKTVMAIKGAIWNSSLFYLPHPIYVLHRRQK